MDEKLRIGVLVSGTGSNLTAIIDSIEKKELKAEITVVISNKRTASALDRAKAHGINAIYLDPDQSKNVMAYDKKIVELLKDSKVGWVVLAGYLKIVSEVLLSAYPNRILNIHPSLLPAFTGLHAQQQALSYGVKVSGCTVHLVDSGIDSGPIVVQAAVPVLDNDSVETLRKRILEKEHKIYPMVLRWISENRLRIEGRRVSLASATYCPDIELINPGGS